MMRAFLRVLGCWSVLTASLNSVGADWPTFRHDTQRSGVTAEGLKTPLNLQWLFHSPTAPATGWSLPLPWYGFVKNKPNISYDDAFRVVAVGDTAYFCSSGENCAYAVDVRAGKVKWRFFTDAAPRHAPVIWQDKVYFGADDGNVYCLNAADGQRVWQFRAAPTHEQMLGYERFSSLWPVRGGVMIDDGVLYFTAGLFPSEGIYLFALDPRTGKQIYCRAMDHGHFAGPAPQGYLLATEDNLFFTTRGQNLRYDKRTGKKKKTHFPLPKITRSHEWKGVLAGSNARIIGNQLVVGSGCLGFYEPGKEMIDAYKRKYFGALLFDIPHAYEVIIKDKTAYVLALTHLAAYPAGQLADVANREYRDFHKAFGDCNVAGKIITEAQYAKIVREGGEEDPRARHMKRTTFKWSGPRWKKWEALGPQVTAKLKKRSKWFTPFDAHETMIMAGDTLFVGGEGHVHAVDSKTGKACWSQKTGSRVRGLTVASGCLFVSTTDGKVRCYSPAAAPGSPRQVLPPPDQKSLVNAEASALAKKVTAAAGWRRGYALIVGAADAALAAELAKQTELKISVLAHDAGQAASIRQALARSGLYGGRVTVQTAESKELPFPPYVFNVVVDEDALGGKTSTIPVQELIRVTRPLGGVVLVRPGVDTGILKKHNVTADKAAGLTRLVRGRIPGSKDWTHNYATAANTYCSEDKLVKAPFGVLWYGEPGPQDRIERHASPPVPLVINGIILTLGYDRVLAYDVYNGIEHWRRNIMGVTTSGIGRNASNTAAEGDSLFVLAQSRECYELDIKTGKTLRTITAPKREGEEYNFWSWLAVDERTIYGSRAEVDERRRRPKSTTSDGLFALDRKTGHLKWSYDSDGIEHAGICLADGKVFFIDPKLSDGEKKQALANTIIDQSVKGRELKDTKGNPLPPRLGKLVALDAETGRTLWQNPVDLTDMTIDERAMEYKSTATLGCMYKDGYLVLHGSGSFGHPWRDFVEGKFARRALYVYDAKDGKLIWGGRKGYRKRPLIVGEWIYAEPSAWHLKTGKQKMIENPLSGRKQKLDMHRGYIGCGHLLASGAAIFGNANGGIAAWNVDSRCGYTPFGDMWLGCGLGLTPANGVLAALEGRAGCNCGTPIHTSVVLYPRRRPRVWGGGAYGGIYKGDAQNLPVKHLSVNLGAPGFRQDSAGNLWLAYLGTPHRMFPGSLVPNWYPGYQHVPSMFYDAGVDRLRVSGTDIPWVYCSGYKDTRRLWFTLLDKGSPPAKYTVRLHFAEPRDLKPGQRVFDVRLQGKTVLTAFDIVKEAGGARKALLKAFRGVEINDRIFVGMKPTDDSELKEPILCGIQAFAQ